MGQPKKQKKKYNSPKKPWDSARIEEEKTILKEFGLKRKKEIWRAESLIKKFRRRARILQANKNEEKIKELIKKAYTMGVIEENAELDDILGLETKSLLERRLQTLVHKKGLANTLKHSRQLITHGHVMVENRKIKWPSMIITRELENKIKLDNKTERGTEHE